MKQVVFESWKYSELQNSGYNFFGRSLNLDLPSLISSYIPIFHNTTKELQLISQYRNQWQKYDTEKSVGKHDPNTIYTQ